MTDGSFRGPCLAFAEGSSFLCQPCSLQAQAQARMDDEEGVGEEMDDRVARKEEVRNEEKEHLHYMKNIGRKLEN